jgi:hypothetical protein
MREDRIARIGILLADEGVAGATRADAWVWSIVSRPCSSLRTDVIFMQHFAVFLSFTTFFPNLSVPATQAARQIPLTKELFEFIVCEMAKYYISPSCFRA